MGQTVIDTPEGIKLYRMHVLLSGLGLEMKGLKMSSGRRSCYVIIKQEFKLKGNRAKVHAQFKLVIESTKLANQGVSEKAFLDIVEDL